MGAVAATGLAMAPAAEAVTRYADDAGATTGNCQTEVSACTIERATSAFGDTTEVVVLPGTYTTTSTVFVPGINVHGQAGSPVPVINSTAGGPAVQLYSTGARLADVKVNKTGGQFGAVTLSSNDQPLVERVEATTSVVSASACFVASGILRDSTCVSTGTNGQAVTGNIAGQPDTFRPKLRNVTAVAIAAGSEGVSFSSGAEGVGVHADLKNVIAQGVEADIFAANCNAGSGTSVTATNSNYSTTLTSTTGGCQAATITAAGSGTNQTADPKFVGFPTDLHQQPDSPTIDAGTTDADLGSLDFDRQARNFDDAPDIGADEFVLAPGSLGAINPAGPANDNAPEVTGTAPEGTTVALYGSATCTGNALASGTRAQFASPGVTLAVPDNSVTNVYIRAVDAFGNKSACVGPLTYREVTPAAGPGPVTLPGATNPGTTEPKPKAKAKCKKPKKGSKKKRCKKPKRK